MGVWEVRLELIRTWLDEQDEDTVAHVMAAVEVLGERGPALGRPLVDVVKHSRFKNMKELRPSSPSDSEIRILFAFDPSRSAVMWLAGDKSQEDGGDKWNGWYKKAIPEADRLFEAHLRRMEEQ